MLTLLQGEVHIKMFKTNILCIDSKYFTRNFNLDVILKVVSRPICFCDQWYKNFATFYWNMNTFENLKIFQHSNYQDLYEMLSFDQTDFRFKHFCLVVQKLPEFTDPFPWITSRSKPHSFEIRIISKTFMSTQLFMPLSKM